ncbi:uncharacterized protein LOC143018763 [Oratosquilla oratoria]|uniref:uncharacterized protein LOC143018763 n=1 Tax=Oratosquilla oratoria TaxID=337810 RepID=UPI003F776A39
MTDDQQQEVSAFHAPPFSNRDPTIWFTILECNFKANRITTSLTKFSHACGLLPSDVLFQFSDTISKAPTSGTPYEDLKKAVLDRLECSEATRLQELLSKELGDKYATFDNSILLHLFYQRLPPTIQGNLFSAKNKLALDEIATLADDFMASVPVARPTISNLADQSATQALTELVSKLTLQNPELEGGNFSPSPEFKVPNRLIRTCPHNYVELDESGNLRPTQSPSGGFTSSV